MGRKSNSFRHCLTAYADPKIRKLKELGGLKAVGAYWTLLEVYGASYVNDDECKIEQELNHRHIANEFGLRSDSTRTVIELMEECELIEALFCKSTVSSIKVSIPNFLKYFGSYKKTEDLKCPNKRKEKKRKEKESKIKEIKEKKENDQKSKFDLEALYQKYPRKIGKKKGLEKLSKEINTQEDYDKINIAINNYISYTQNDNLKFIKHFSTFVSDWKDWLDYTLTPQDERAPRFLSSPAHKKTWEQTVQDKNFEAIQKIQDEIDELNKKNRGNDDESTIETEFTTSDN